MQRFTIVPARQRESVNAATEFQQEKGPCPGWETIEVTPENHPGVAVFPRFASPSWFDNRRTTKSVNVVGATTVHLGQLEFHDFVAKFRQEKLQVSVSYQPVAFAKMIAKIAYGYCVAHFGLQAVRTSYVLPAVLGVTDDIGTWVGSTAGKRLELSPPPNGRILHRIRTDVVDGDIVAYVRLFAWAVPEEEYIVVIASTQGTPERTDDLTVGP